MLKLIVQNLEKRKIQTASIFLAIVISTAVLFSLLLLYDGVSKGIETSGKRMGADIMVVPSEVEGMIEETDLLFTGVPTTIYMSEDVESIIADVKGVEATTVQFYGQTLGSACCSTGTEQRIIGYDAESDWIIKPWINQSLSGELGENEVIIGCNVGGFEDGEGMLLGRKTRAVAVLEPSGTNLDFSILVNLDTARSFSKEIEGYDHFWEKYGQPEELISAVMVKTTEDKKASVANLIELKGDFKCITSSDVLGNLQNQMKVIFIIMLGAGILLGVASVFQLFARFYSMAWERKSELGLYRAMGASERDLKILILGEALLITSIGSIAGLTAGAGLYNLLLWLLVEETGFPFITPSFLTILLDVTILIILACLVGYLAVLAPLRQIGRIDPSIAMRKNDID
ncbi:ABC transporter permease [bacterium 210820-DFI.6.37]|nr:ABC transporter permease [bacterium 210820-DFI.6.37]